jgi:effector-binding domain-containing protein
VGRLFDELRDYARRHGTCPLAWISVWHDEEYRDEEVDGEAAFATEDPLPEDGRVLENLLPAAEKMASTVHHGSFDTIGGAYAALLAWIEENGYRVAGPNREIYLRGGDEQGNSAYVTEIQFPVEKAVVKERPT